MAKPRKPKNVVHKLDYQNGTIKPIIVAEVFEDFYSEHFMEEGDPLYADRDVRLWGDDSVFDGFNNKDQAKISRQLAKFFAQYADWIEAQNEGRE